MPWIVNPISFYRRASRFAVFQMNLHLCFCLVCIIMLSLIYFWTFPVQSISSWNVQKHQQTAYNSKTGWAPIRFVIWCSMTKSKYSRFSRQPVCRLCKACRSAALKFPPETARGSRHGICCEVSSEILLFLFPQEVKLESAQAPEHFMINFTPLFTTRFAAANAQFHSVFHSAAVCL